MNPVDYRKDLTEKIIQALLDGTAPWVKPWNENKPLAGMPYNAVSERPYHGGNSLWLQCQLYDDPRWCTYKQAQQQGWQVNKGEKASVVEYWQWDEQQKDVSGQVVRVKLEHPRVFYAHVFNAQQMQNVPALVPIEGHQWQIVLLGGGEHRHFLIYPEVAPMRIGPAPALWQQRYPEPIDPPA